MGEIISVDSVVKFVNGVDYIMERDMCSTCEFVPPCRLCTWVSRELISEIYDNEIESLLPRNRKWHLKNRVKMLRKAGVRENKGRGNIKGRNIRKARKVGKVEPDDGIMVI